MVTRLLLIDDCRHIGAMMGAIVDRYFQNDVELCIASTLETGLMHIGLFDPDLILLDYRLKPHHDCRATVPAVRDTGFAGPIHIWSSSEQFTLKEALNNPDVVGVYSKLDYHGMALKKLISAHLLPTTPCWQNMKPFKIERFLAFN